MGSTKKKYEEDQVVVGIAHSYGWNLLFIATPQILKTYSWNAKATKLQDKVTSGADFTAGKFCHPPGSGTGRDSERVPRMGHAARDKPSSCLPGSSIKEVLLAEGMQKNESKLSFYRSAFQIQELVDLETFMFATRWCLLLRH